MANIPDFENIPDDEFRRVLSSVLNDLNKDANRPEDVTLGSNVILAWIDDGKTVLPKGYEIADGQKGTFDANKSKIIYIQKVK